MNRYLELLKPTSKIPLQNFVNSEDDLGPEMIMNLKWLDCYRYEQKSVFLYLSLMQDLKLKYNWSHMLTTAQESDSEDPFFEICKDDSSNFMHPDLGINEFPEYMRRAPYLFSILNHILIDCKFTYEKE